METEKVNTGETAPNKDFLDRVDEIADELQSMAELDKKNRAVWLIVREGDKFTLLLRGLASRLSEAVAKSMVEDAEKRDIMLKTFYSWLKLIGPRNAFDVTEKLHESVKKEIHEAVKAADKSKAEA